jgi:UDP-N-acetylglucosamine 2-epimerase
MKVMTVLGTRPEIVKLSRVIHELDKHTEHVLVHTGQNYDPKLKDIFFDEMGIRKPDEQFGGKPSSLPIGQIWGMAHDVDCALEKHKPDAVLVLGDTNSALSVYAAKRRHIPIFHLEAGNRCFDERVPEEVNRRIVDHISDINMPYTEHARRNLLAEGVAPDRIIKTGSPMFEVIYHYTPQILNSNVLERLNLNDGKYYVVSAHREENVDNPERLLALVNLVNSLPGTVVFSVHPRTRQRLDAAKYLFKCNVILSEPLGFFCYARLQRHAACVLSDSGTLTEEAALLNFPAVMLRQAHERPEGMDAGTAVMADIKDALPAAAVAIDTHDDAKIPDDYGRSNVSTKVVRTILSYTSYVNRTVWRK